MQSLDSYFKYSIEKNASDIHLVGEEKPMVRIDGELQEIEKEPLSDKELRGAVMDLLTAEQKKRFEETQELDTSYTLDNARFRVNLHMQQGKVGLAARLIPKDIPSAETLHFEPTLQELTKLSHGLILVVGPTGNGKSTTIASMIEEINKTRKAHIVTVEDPIEFLFKDKMSLIEQREIGIDTQSFAAALKHVLRQDPNVIFVGEMRDPETIATVLTAAETGHLVFSTLHTGSAAEAVERIVDVFDGAKQRQVLIQLATVLQAVIAQELLPGKNGGRVAAREILINTSAVSNLIRENHIAQIKSTLQTGVKQGMVTMEQSVKALVKEGLIEKEVAERFGV